jgi:hypothetical protein
VRIPRPGGLLHSRELPRAQFPNLTVLASHFADANPDKHFELLPAIFADGPGAARGRPLTRRAPGVPVVAGISTAPPASYR